MTGLKFDDKTVMITGASRGIGRHLAIEFASAGARVVVNYNRNEEAAISVVDTITNNGGQAIAVGADISDAVSVHKMLDATLTAFASVDVLVNNAGINKDNSLLEMSEEEWTRVVDVNLKGPFLCTQAFGRVMVSAGTGKIVNISAVTSIQGRANAVNYCSSKAGLNMLTKCSALELAPAVHVNGIAVGFIESELVREIYSQEQIDRVNRSVALGRMGSIEEVTNLVMYLSSDGSNFMTGQTIVLDGGRVMI